MGAVKETMEEEISKVAKRAGIEEEVLIEEWESNLNSGSSNMIPFEDFLLKQRHRKKKRR